jgi:microsomal dipeptidase-like Zn-dependent dipeptidase
MTPPGTVTGQAVRRVLREAGSNLAGQILTNFHSLEELNDFHALLGIMGGISGPQCEPRGGGSPIHCGRCLDAKNPIACENVLGLTPLGRWFIGELMNRHMLIDVAHMSERGIREAVAMAREHQPAPYPVYVSHGNPRSALVAGAFKGPHMEKPSSDEILELIAATGGMFGQRTGADAMISSGINDCQGSSKAFAEALKYLVDFSETNSDPLPIAFALDMNGMTHQAVPRFVDSTDARTERRSDRAACLGNDIAQGIQQRPVSDHPATPFTDETDLNRKGLGHIGLLGAFVDDLENVGLDQKYLDALDSSAESFLQMWERSR